MSAEGKGLFYDAFGWINRCGADDLLEWLESRDFFTAPASTRYHGNYSGGLCDHSVNVFQQMEALYKAEIRDIDPHDPDDQPIYESIAVCSLLHDVCKVDYYKPVTRSGRTHYTVDDLFPMGHGEKSVYLINQFITLSPAEALAIRWHMGAWDAAVKGGDRSISQVYQRFPLATSHGGYGRHEYGR